MRWKKNSISFLIRGIYLLLIYCFFISMCNLIAEKLEIRDNFIVAGASCVILFVFFCIYIFIKHFKSKLRVPKFIKNSSRCGTVLEVFFVCVILAFGLILRYQMIPIPDVSDIYYNAALIAENKSVPQMVQGSTYLYLQILHLIFFIVGNKWIAGIWLQIILQLMTILVTYFVVKETAGKFAGIVSLLFLTFLPIGIENSIVYNPYIFFMFLFSIVLLFFVKCIKSSMLNSKINFAFLLKSIICGGLIGILIYFNIYGCIILFFFLTLRRINKESIVKKSDWVSYIFVLILGIVLAWFGSFFIDAFLSGGDFLDITQAWFTVYQPVKLEFNKYLLQMFANLELEKCILLICTLLLGCFGFWNENETEIFSPWVYMFLGNLTLFIFQMGSTSMDGSFFLYYLGSILAGISTAELFIKEVTDSSLEESEMETVMEVRPFVALAGEGNVQFIKNPLPIPKKHIKKVMDYQFIPKESQMKYDIEVSDDDDYDF